MDRSISKILDAITTIKNGGMVIMVDDEDRENEGDVVFAAEHATPEKINFMAKEARGLICLPLAPEIVDQLKLPLMDDASKGSGGHTTAFTVSIEARSGVTTGISAADRAHTCRVAIAQDAKPDDLVVPGHIFPLRAKKGGVLERSGHTEGSVDLARLSGCKPGAVICEIMNDDGTMARRPDLLAFAERHKMPMITIEDLIAYRLTKDCLVRQVDHRTITLNHSEIELLAFTSVLDGSIHFALIKGRESFATTVVDVRVHRQKTFLDVFNRGPSSQFAGHDDHIQYGLTMLKTSKAAAFIYLSHPAPSSPHSFSFQEIFGPHLNGHQSGSANYHQSDDARSSGLDSRILGIGAQIIRSLGIQRMRTHVTQQRSLKGLAGYGLEVVDHVVISSLKT